MAFESSFWRRFGSVIDKATDQSESVFLPPATAQQIQEVERSIGLRFPDDLREAYLFANDVRGPNDQNMFSLFVRSIPWVPLDNSPEDWKFDRDVEAGSGQDFVVLFDKSGAPLPSPFDEPTDPLRPMRVDKFDRRRVPIGHASTWMIYCDLGPTHHGTLAQFLFYDYQQGGPSWYAPGFGEYCAKLLELVEAGKVRTGEHLDAWAWADSGKSIRPEELFPPPPGSEAG
jgi:cell wall assembly regulator SMI1